MAITGWAVWRAALRHQLLLTFRDRRTLILVAALSLLFGLVGARTLAQQAGGGLATMPVREIAVSPTRLPAEVQGLITRAGLLLVVTQNPEGAVVGDEVPLGLVLEPVPGAPDQVRVRFVAKASNASAMAIAGELTALLGIQEDQRLRAQGVNLPARLLPTVGVVGLRQPATEEWVTMLLTLLVVVPAIGATGAATELGAGEKERKTLEPLLMTPLPPFVLAGAKLAAVLAASLLAAGLATGVQVGLLFWMARQSPQALPVEPAAAVLPILLLCITVAVLISGPALLISLVARSSREATLAMIPLNLGSIGLAYLAVSLPPQGLGGGLWYTPGLGALMMVRLTLAGAQVSAGQVMAVIVATLLLGLGLTWLAARQLRRETVL